MRVLVLLIWVAVFLFVSEASGPAEAYLDPGTGSMALQIILGSVVAGLTAVRLYWARLAAFFSKGRSDGDVPADEHTVVR
jgi:hypothetical protein